MTVNPTIMDKYRINPVILLGSFDLSLCNISKNTMYNIVPVATADNSMMAGESDSDILASVNSTINIPSGDMKLNIDI